MKFEILRLWTNFFGLTTVKKLTGKLLWFLLLAPIGFRRVFIGKYLVVSRKGCIAIGLEIFLFLKSINKNINLIGPNKNLGRIAILMPRVELLGVVSGHLGFLFGNLGEIIWIFGGAVLLVSGVLRFRIYAKKFDRPNSIKKILQA
jgi:hypothetical protein